MCPQCGSNNSRVGETRRLDSGIYRRRYCKDCGQAYITCEYSEPGMKMPEEVTQASIARVREHARRAVEADGEGPKWSNPELERLMFPPRTTTTGEE